MLRSALQLRGYRIEAKDGEIGKAHDLFFDDGHWGVRYLVIDTGTWLPGRRVLVSPAALNQPDWRKYVFPVRLTKEQIENSPSVLTDRPVSRQLEKDIVDHFGWPVYWAPPTFGMGAAPRGALTPEEQEQAPPPQPKGDPNLRSMSEVAGYNIQATDGELGHVEDFIIDDGAWTVRYLVVDTQNWLPGRKVILAPDWFSSFDWRAQKAFTDLGREAIKDAPAYDPSQPINRDYEGRLHDYFGRPGYWTEAVSPGTHG